MDSPAGTRKQRRAAPREARRAREEAARRHQQRQRRQRWLWFGGGGVIVVVLLGIVAIAGRAQAAPTIDGIQCVATEGSVTHTHQHLTIYDAGRAVPVPQDIGINAAKACLFAVHTHDASGVIHVESPSQDQNTLGQFFNVWGQPLSRTQVASASAGRGHTVRAYVNGRLYRGDPRAIPLTPHALITLEVGPPWVAPDTHFAWPQGT